LNVVFDFGGVLFRWEPHVFMMRLRPERAPDVASSRALVSRFFESFGGDWGDFDRGTIERGALADRIVERTGLARAEVDQVIDAVPHELQPMAESVALMKRLRARGHVLYFLSNMPAPYADHLEASHDFIALFRDGVFSARVQLIKPDPAIFAHATQAFGIDPADTVFIDDLSHNAEAARAAGWKALHFESAARCEQDLQAMGLL
jgi:putative hydrolase of the HAD superfamily